MNAHKAKLKKELMHWIWTGHKVTFHFQVIIDQKEKENHLIMNAQFFRNIKMYQ